MLTGSGTGALALALHHAATPGCTVALPAYACPDLGTAAIAAGAGIRLYDVDPRTLGPDWDSLDAALDGADLVVGAHLFGRLVDIGEITRRAKQVGAVVIEDAAQFAGGTREGISGGALAAWSILSFGRGKGLNTGGGGALMVQGDGLPAVALSPASGATVHLLKTTVSEYLARPAAYGIPARIPALGLGDTVYRPPVAPTGISPVAAALLPEALRTLPLAAAARRSAEQRYETALRDVSHLQCCNAEPIAVSGALRFPLLASPEQMAPLRPLGIARAYPRTLLEYAEIAQRITNGSGAFPGARELAARLHTLPTHGLLTPHDIERIINQVSDNRSARKDEWPAPTATAG
jgi:dTDP-4-amino-4,6-dideoxygalactose transaminase